MDSPPQPKRTYHVFLSFRGPDVRDNILSHLYKALDRRGIYTYIDSEELRKGERISDALTKAIEESRIALILFSENYASSAWCLDEVVKMMECKETDDLIVLPVFFKVEPKEVREGRKSYKKAFDSHEKKYSKEDVKKWKKALEDAGNLSGWEFNDGVITQFTTGTPIQLGSRAFKDEAELVESIVKEISIQLNRRPLHVAKYPVGIDSRVRELKSKWNMKSRDETLTIGLWAMGGMGKTTLAKALYNSTFRDFEGSVFLDGIKGTSRESPNMARLQEKLLSQILMTKEIPVPSVHEGINSIKEKLCRKRVLLILDGVDNICQTDALAGAHDWFGKGSTIIITTTDEGVLKINGACIYEVKALEDAEARELFKKYASGNRKVEIREDLLDKALQYTHRLPLALEVLGCAFCASSERKWEGELNKFVKSPDQTINAVLKLSYDGLDEDRKEIFLHIACFFNGWSRKYVEGVLDSCDLDAASGVDDLIRRSLIRDENGTLQMHDLIELMGKKIVDQKQRENPTKRSRLWRHQEVVDVLSSNEGRDAVEAIVLALPEPEKIEIDSDTFANLTMLKFLIMINVETSFQGPIRLPKELRWFEWPECRASSLKFTSTPKNLAVLAVRRSLIKELGKP
ncbi:disease resistance protein RUN1-like [Rhodamnia argentea]|uniref:Disease resistance protein RUN1-like n=1 Tax=Rhodamnia argentea TaxID=178133 RepID=A0A8B8MUD2_9MYRT|nr:disease resistance protein RUN1-like [Rhodamnia argentea]